MIEGTRDAAIRKVEEQLEAKEDETEKLRKELHEIQQVAWWPCQVRNVMLTSFIIVLLAALFYTMVHLKTDDTMKDLQYQLVNKFSTKISEIEVEKSRLQNRVKRQKNLLKSQKSEISSLWRRYFRRWVSCIQVFQHKTLIFNNVSFAFI